MKKNWKKYLAFFAILIITTFLFTGFAHVTNIKPCINPSDTYGFWGGFWHGIIAFFSFIGSLFSNDIAIYASLVLY